MTFRDVDSAFVEHPNRELAVDTSGKLLHGDVIGFCVDLQRESRVIGNWAEMISSAESS